MRGRWAAIAALTPSLVWAQPDDAAVEAAQTHILAGRAHFAAGRYADGIAAYEAAHEALPDVRHLFVIASAWARVPDAGCPPALAAWDRFLTECAGACEERADGEARRAALVATCPVRVRIESEPTGAAVEVDGRPVGTAPLDLELTPGAHAVAAEIGGSPRLRTEIKVEPEMPVKVPLRFAAPTSVTVPVPVRLREPDNTWATVAFGAAAVGALASGLLALQMTASVGDFEAAESERAALNARDDAEREAIWAQVALGVAIAGTLTGVLLWESEPTVVVAPTGAGAALTVRF